MMKKSSSNFTLNRNTSSKKFDTSADCSLTGKSPSLKQGSLGQKKAS